MSKSAIPVPVQLTWLYVGVLVTLASGVGMLKRQNWARYLYVIWCGIDLLIGFLTAPVKVALIPGLVVYSAITLLLFRPNANDYFTTRER